MNLANKLRPKSLDNIYGQNKIIDIFKKLIANDKIPHSLFFGPAGTGKTTLAKAIALAMNYEFYEFDGANFKAENLRKILAKYDNSLLKPLIFIDEFHRLSKNQQEILLIPMERQKCIIMGATTENPKFIVSSGIRSRMMIFEFSMLSDEDLEKMLENLQKNLEFEINEDAKKYLISSSAGDARSLLNLLDFALGVSKDINLDLLKTLRSSAQGEGANSADTHYALISPFIKSMRGSDVDAALYYLARMINAGEDAAFIARRMVIFASEDIGNANPNALNLAVSTMQAVSLIGYPEARIILSQCAVYLASSPKSNSSYKAINFALEFVKQNARPVPEYLINTSPKAHYYKYPHDFGGWVEQDYMGFSQKFYESNQIGFEKTLSDWHSKITKNKK